MDSDGVVKTVHLKSTTDKINPTFFLKGTDDYVYCKAWGMYYFVHRISYDIDGAQMVYCNLDVLATFKADILSTRAYIIYSSTGYDRWIRDDRCPIVIKGSTYVHASSAIVLNNYALFEATGDEIVIISTVSKERGVVHWVTTEATFARIVAQLMEATDSVWESLQKAFGDAMGSVIQIRRMPITNEAINSISDGPYDVYFGNYMIPDFDVPAEALGLKKLSQTYVSLQGGISIPATYADFRYTEPYCHARLSLPFVGVVDVSLSDFAPSGGIEWEMDLDLITGNIIYTLYDTALTQPIASYSGQCGSQIPIASQQISTASQIVTGVGGSLLTFGIGTMTGNATMAVGGGVSSIMAVANAFYASAHKSTSVVGAYSGGRSEYANRQVRLTVEKFATAIEPSNLTDIEGRPVCKVDTINNYSGYVRCHNFNIDISALDVIKDMINGLMDGGVYLE